MPPRLGNHKFAQAQEETECRMAPWPFGGRFVDREHEAFLGHKKSARAVVGIPPHAKGESTPAPAFGPSSGRGRQVNW